MSRKDIHKILIANRGEIALRIISTAKKMGISTILPVTEAELNSLPARQADEVFIFANSNLPDTYLNAITLIDIAKKYQADAVHPGYGFLSEDAGFASAVERAGLTWIGPSPDSVAQMGNKLEARKIAEKAGVRVTKALSGSIEEILDNQEKLRYPLLIKAAAGGGGKGMKIAQNKNELKSMLKATSREALNYFGNPTVFVEEYIENPRHIEVQVLGDQYGNIVHLFERECSIQRRYQKIIEEAPSPYVHKELRGLLTSDALKLCKEINYYNAGTVEFLVDDKGEHFFLEMNTRLQVEHPVTEAITGIDLVEEQIKIAMGMPLSFSEADITMNGHAVETRIYAENALNDFSPEPGEINFIRWPEKRIARTDTFFDNSTEIQPHFDPMLAKITSWGYSREMAIKKLTASLEQTTILGVTTNLPYLREVLKTNAFNSGETTTQFTTLHKDELQRAIHPNGTDKTKLLLAGYLLWLLNFRNQSSENLFSRLGHRRWNGNYNVCFNEKTYSLSVISNKNNTLQWQVDGNLMDEIRLLSFEETGMKFSFHDREYILSWYSLSNGELMLGTGGYTYRLKPGFMFKQRGYQTNIEAIADTDIVAPIPGKITAIPGHPGEIVEKGTPIVVLEAMKMENSLSATTEGTIEEILVTLNEQVKAGQLLARIKVPQQAQTHQEKIS
ncbi:acetyl/propionyl/methylcrotonyl-CoA carboxylase subunit alpha [Marinilabilia salmonicolor]|uniref:acetyl/propionyl/methylcrotonyl-CoA carboxylase subunit alpha n=1 Tax=Marinilabilia salmonicolor TaxID=989 RepID=UPI00029A1B34|nr:biotin carboxylase N-terminal domain-containing protein [Marinilabilia salmonicolor]